MGTEFVSLRKQLKGTISDFLDGEKMECPYTENGLVDIINALSLYREEGKSLFPKIFIFDDLDVILKILVIHEHIRIGEGQKNHNVFLNALKRCAPLAQGGWAIYILRKANSFEFGLIRSIGNILSISIENALIETGVEDLPIIMTHQISEKYVRVAKWNQMDWRDNRGDCLKGIDKIMDHSPKISLCNFVRPAL